MIFLKIIQLLVLILFAWLLISQILIPAFKGTKLFPAFSKRRATVEEKIIEVKEDIELNSKESYLRDLERIKENISRGNIKR